LQGIAAVAALLTLQAVIALGGALVGFAPLPLRPFHRTSPSSGAGGSSSSGGGSSGGGAGSSGGGSSSSGAGSGSSGGGSSGSSGGGSSSSGGALELTPQDPDRGPAEAIDLGESISIIATVVEEHEDGPVAAPRRCCGCLRAVGGAPRAPADALVGLLALCSALLALAAAARAAALYLDNLFWEDRLLLTLQALPELLSAALLLAPPHLMARTGMASRYARWQPRKGKPPASRPKNSNPAIWKRAGLPAPESRTQTQSEGI
jgi:hypothetical protein